MTPITQSVPSLAGGISQVPATLRDPSQSEDILNAIASLSRGLITRPPTWLVALIGTLGDDLERAFLHPLEFSASERYILLLADGVCRLFDAETGAEQTVTVPASVLPYLADLDPDQPAFDALTIGSETLVLNKSKVVALGGSTAASRAPEALVYVRAGDFATNFGLVLDGYSVNHRTAQPEASSREYIATDYIAQRLESELLASPLSPQYEIARNGGVLYIRRVDGQDFTLTSFDGLAGEALLVIKGSVLSEDDLPLTVPEEAVGFTVAVRRPGAVSDGQGEYWLRYDESRWTETVRPGVRDSLDRSTMPHLLKRGPTVIEKVVHSGSPRPPVVSSAQSALSAVAWDVPDEAALVLNASGTSVQTVPISAYDGNEWTTRFRYSVSASNLPELFTATVYWESSTNGVSWTTEAVDSYTANDVPVSAERVFIESLPSNSLWRVRLEFSDPLGFYDFSLSLYSTWGGGPGASISNQRRKLVTFDADEVYPGGLQATLVINGASRSYTVPGEFVTGTALATALVGVLGSNPVTNVSAIDNGGGQIILTGTTTAPSVTASHNFTPATTLFSRDAALVPDALIGLVIESLADGSTAIITGNSTKTISAGSWSGLSSQFVTAAEYRVRYPDTDWVLGEAPWESRTAGDEESAPGPSFVGRAITALFAYQNRLGLLSGDALVLSSAKSFYRLYRESSRAVLDADVIDVRSRARPGETFLYAFAWNGGMYLTTKRTQFRLYGDPMLTPRTVGLDVASEYPVSPLCPPAVVGTRLYLGSVQNDSTQIVEMFQSEQGTLIGVPITSSVPTLIQGIPLRIVGNGTLGHLLVLTQTESGRSLWSLNTAYGGEGLAQAAWTRWELGGADSFAVNLVAVAENIILLVRRQAGFCVERMDLLEGADTEFAMLDSASPVTGVVAAGSTSWTTPPAYNGRTVTVVTANGTVVSGTPSAGTLTVTGTHAGSAVVGYPYSWQVQMSPFFVRQRDGTVDRTGRLVLTKVRLFLARTRSLEAQVQTAGRSTKTIAFLSETPTDTQFGVPVLAVSEGTIITIGSSLPFSAQIAGLEWDGHFTPRTRRV